MATLGWTENGSPVLNTCVGGCKWYTRGHPTESLCTYQFFEIDFRCPDDKQYVSWKGFSYLMIKWHILQNLFEIEFIETGFFQASWHLSVWCLMQIMIPYILKGHCKDNCSQGFMISSKKKSTKVLSTLKNEDLVHFRTLYQQIKEVDSEQVISELHRLQNKTSAIFPYYRSTIICCSLSCLSQKWEIRQLALEELERIKEFCYQDFIYRNLWRKNCIKWQRYFRFHKWQAHLVLNWFNGCWKTIRNLSDWMVWII